MQKIADKFKSLDRAPTRHTSTSSIFGSTNLTQNIGEKQNPTISMYPIVYGEDPEFAMGIASCLCYILEQYDKVRVYRVFAKFDLEDDSDEINDTDFQFHANQWEFEGLDDNILIQGSMNTIDDKVSLEFDIDTSLLVGNSTDKHLTYQYSDHLSLMNDLAKIAKDMLDGIIEIRETELIITYDYLSLSLSDLQATLSNVFYWNLDIYLYMWESEWQEDDIVSQIDEMIALFKSSNSQFVLWCTLMMCKQVMTIDLATIGEVITPSIERLTAHETEISTTANVIFSKGLMNLGYLNQAIDVLSLIKQNSPNDVSVWLTLVELYSKSNDIGNAVDSAQIGLEVIPDNVQLLWYYAQLLMTILERELTLESVMFIEPEEIDENDHLVQEIIQVLYEIHTLKPDAFFATKLLLEFLIRTNDIKALDLLGVFLSNSQSSPEEIRSLIDKFYDNKYFDELIVIFESYAELSTDDSWVHIYLAQLYTLCLDFDAALRSLDSATAHNSNNDMDIVVEIQKLYLDLEIENFAHEYSNIVVMLNANRAITDDAVDLLESAIEIAPLLADLHVTLARCYLSWNDTESALEVLSEVDTAIKEHPSILLIQSEILWSQNKRSEALKVLNSILDRNPNDIDSLTKLAELLIENNQLDDSRIYIERAETLAPSHPKVWNLRKVVVSRLR